ncbi:MAG: hypothetical protein WBA22_17950 [Candidatus Methanofastidiosia archaeon]
MEADEEGRLYLNGIRDFMKWTSTFAVAAILWIGNAVTSMVGISKLLAIIGLCFLIISLLVAINSSRTVLYAQAQYWKRHLGKREGEESVSSFFWEAGLTSVLLEKMLSLEIDVHLYSLLAGFLFYVLAVLLANSLLYAFIVSLAAILALILLRRRRKDLEVQSFEDFLKKAE